MPFAGDIPILLTHQFAKRQIQADVMKKLLLLIFAIILAPQMYAKVNLDTIISQITKVQLRKNPTDTIKLIKTKIKLSDYIPINQKCDTIFINEVRYPEGDSDLGVWNKKIFVYFNMTTGKIIFEQPRFSDPIIDRINSWDVKWLTEFWKNPKIIVRRDTGMATTTRIIIHNGFASFETICYEQPIINRHHDGTIEVI